MLNIKKVIKAYKDGYIPKPNEYGYIRPKAHTQLKITNNINIVINIKI